MIEATKIVKGCMGCSHHIPYNRQNWCDFYGKVIDLFANDKPSFCEVIAVITEVVE